MNSNQQIRGTFNSSLFFIFTNLDDFQEEETMPAQESPIENGDHEENPSLRQIESFPITEEN